MITFVIALQFAYDAHMAKPSAHIESVPAGETTSTAPPQKCRTRHESTAVVAAPRRAAEGYRVMAL